MWIAREYSGELNIFVIKPERYLVYWHPNPAYFKKTSLYSITINRNLFPNLTYEDDPIEIEDSIIENYLYSHNSVIEKITYKKLMSVEDLLPKAPKIFSTNIRFTPFYLNK